MEIKNTFLHMASKPDLHSAVGVANNKNSLELNCMRIGIVQEFYKEDLTVSVLIANKRDSKQYSDGTEATRNYALIRAKVCYCNPFVSYEIKEGDECVLLFSDREIESWFVNGDVNPVAYPRMHDLTDAVAIFGIRSLPNMIEILNGCLHIFHTKVLVDNLHASNGVTGTFVSKDNKGVTVTDGIVTNLTGASPSPDITADDIINALEYTPADTDLSNLSSTGQAIIDGKADTDLSNLSATGKTVIDGQWVQSFLDLVTSAITLNTSYSNAWDISSYLPNDNYIYEVYVSAYGVTTATSGALLDVRVGSSILKANNTTNSATAFVLRSSVRSNANRQVSNTIVIPVGTDRQLTVRSYGTGTLNTLRLLAYRRVGTNT